MSSERTLLPPKDRAAGSRPFPRGVPGPGATRAAGIELTARTSHSSGVFHPLVRRASATIGSIPRPFWTAKMGTGTAIPRPIILLAVAKSNVFTVNGTTVGSRAGRNGCHDERSKRGLGFPFDPESVLTDCLRLASSGYELDLLTRPEQGRPQERSDGPGPDHEESHGDASAQLADEVLKGRSLSPISAEEGEQSFIVANLLPRLAHLQREVLLVPSETADFRFELTLGDGEGGLPIAQRPGSSYVAFDRSPPVMVVP